MGLKVGDLVRLSEHYHMNNPLEAIGVPLERDWRGIVLRQEELIGGLFDDEQEEPEWIIHWLHHPFGEESYEYGYYLEVISESH